jgi:hypothetical protein
MAHVLEDAPSLLQELGSCRGLSADFGCVVLHTYFVPCLVRLESLLTDPSGIIVGQVLVGFEGDWVGRKFGLVQDALVMFSESAVMLAPARTSA